MELANCASQPHYNALTQHSLADRNMATGQLACKKLFSVFEKCFSELTKEAYKKLLKGVCVTCP